MKRRKKGIVVLLSLTLLLAGGISFGRKALKAEGAPEAEVTFGQFLNKNTVEESVLYIGTHLLHVQSMTDQLYELALQSASDSNQNQVYYKSELAAGAWFDITDATGLADISEEGVLVSTEDLKDLKIEYYTYRDGITRSALTGNAVNIFNIKEPYNLYELEELEPLRQQFDQQFSPEDTGVKKYYYDQLREFFLTDVRNNKTAEFDRQINGLQSTYVNLQSQGEQELAEIVMKLMEKIDAARRAEVLYTLSQSENPLLSRLQEICTGSKYKKEDYLLKVEVQSEEEEEEKEEGEEESEEEKEYELEKEQFVENSGVLDAIASSLQNCQSGYTDMLGKRLEEGTTVLKNTEYEKSQQVISQAGSGVESVLRELELIFNIQEDVVRKEAEELAFLTSQLLPKAEAKYQSGLGEGAGEEYKVAVANNVSQAAITQALEQQKTRLNSSKQELQFLIRAMTKRQAPETALEGIYTRIDGIPPLKASIQQDAFQTKAGETLEEYRIWLTEHAKSIMEENEQLASEMDGLEASKEELLMNYQQALDDNDLALAKKYRAMLDLLEEEIKAKQQELQSILEDPNSSPSDKARAQNSSGSSTTLNHMNELKQQALLSLAKGEEDIQNQMDALAALGAEEALNEIADTAKEAGKDKVAKEAENAAAKSKESSLHGLLSDSGPGMEETKFVQGLTEFFGDEFGSLKGSDQAEILVVLDWLLQDGYISLSDLFEEYYESAKELLYIYPKYTQSEEEHLALLAVSHTLDLRYIFDNSRKIVTMSKGSQAYQIRAGEQILSMSFGEWKELSKKAAYQKDVYLIEKDTLTFFGCKAEYLERKDTAVCLSEEMEAEALSFYEFLQEGEE